MADNVQLQPLPSRLSPRRPSLTQRRTTAASREERRDGVEVCKVGRESIRAIKMLGSKGINVVWDTEWQAGREQEPGTGEYQCDGGARWRGAEVKEADGDMED